MCVQVLESIKKNFGNTATGLRSRTSFQYVKGGGDPTPGSIPNVSQ